MCTVCILSKRCSIENVTFVFEIKVLGKQGLEAEIHHLLLPVQVHVVVEVHVRAHTSVCTSYADAFPRVRAIAYLITVVFRLPCTL